MRVVDINALRSMYALEAEEFPIILVAISRAVDSGSSPEDETILLSSDATVRISEDPLAYGTRSRGLEYVFFPFEFTLPQDQAESVPRMQITVANVSAEIGWWLRKSIEMPTVTVEIVSSGDLDTPIATFPDFELSSFSGGTMQVTGMLTLSILEKEPFPGGTFSMSYFPGLF